MRHVVVMSLSASLGLLSIFIVDFVDLYFISLLGESALAAAVGFAGTLIFFNMSITIGLMIAMSALAARKIGEGDEAGARLVATNVLVFGLVIGVVISALFWIYTPALLDMIGAVGQTKDYAVSYLRIVVPSMPIMVTAMVCSGLLRAHGDARRAMMATLIAGAVNAVLDPILIFGLGLGLEGAAWASVAARIAMTVTAVLPILRIYGGFAPFELPRFLNDLRLIVGIAAPAILTNIATPVGNVIVTRAIAPYGDAVMAGYSVIGRLTPLAFCVIFALSGAVGPIIGQNFGAKNYPRVRETFLKSLYFTAAYTLIVWVLLSVLNNLIAAQFSLREEGRILMNYFVWIVAPLFFFNGVLFIANASFNNLNRPTWSTWLNWGKNTIGVAPFVWLGAAWAAAPGVLVGQALGGIFFALLGVWLTFRLVDDFESGRADPGKAWRPSFMRPRPTPPFFLAAGIGDPTSLSSLGGGLRSRNLDN